MHQVAVLGSTIVASMIVTPPRSTVVILIVSIIDIHIKVVVIISHEMRVKTFAVTAWVGVLWVRTSCVRVFGMSALTSVMVLIVVVFSSSITVVVSMFFPKMLQRSSHFFCWIDINAAMSPVQMFTTIVIFILIASWMVTFTVSILLRLFLRI